MMLQRKEYRDITEEDLFFANCKNCKAIFAHFIGSEELCSMDCYISFFASKFKKKK